LSVASSTTAVVTDSTADLPAPIAAASGIRVIPVILVVDGSNYVDDGALSRAAFYERLPTMRRPATTASPPVEAFSSIYRLALDAGARRVVSIHVSGRLSGIVDIARHAAQAFADRVQVVDSGQVSLGLGFQVAAAARAATEEKPVTEILAAAEGVRRRVRTIAMIDDLEYLRRSGRVDWLRSSLSALLRIRLLVELADGVVRRLAQVRTRARAIEALAERARGWGRLERLGVLHSSAMEDAAALASSLAPIATDDPLVVDVTTVIGAHVGPRALGLVGVLADSKSGGDAAPSGRKMRR